MADIEIDVEGAVLSLVRLKRRKQARGYEVHVGNVVVFSDPRAIAARKMARLIRGEVAEWLTDLLAAIDDADGTDEEEDDEDDSDDDFIDADEEEDDDEDDA